MAAAPALNRLPVVFFGHGSPTTILTENEAVKGWREMVADIPRPTAIICISAHWYLPSLRITGNAQPRTIHDFGPLSDRLFEMQYPAPGAPELAADLAEALSDFHAEIDHSWGFDHGCWTVLSAAYPDADVPTIQLSLDASLTLEQHYEVAKRLAAFRARGILIVASGNYIHNLSAMEWREDAEPYAWASAFDTAIKTAISTGNHSLILSPMQEGAAARRSIPTWDHYLPLIYAVGAIEGEEEVEFFNEFIAFKSIGMTSFKTKDAPAPLRDSEPI